MTDPSGAAAATDAAEAADAAEGRARRWADAGLAIALLALDPHALGGVRLRAGAGPVRDAFLRRLRSAWPADWPWRRLPAATGEDRLLGGLDLTATLRSGRPVAQRGLLAEADRGLVVVPMAERLPRGTAAHLAAVLDRGEVVAARDGLSLREPARCAVLALDEATPEDDPIPPALSERLAFDLDLRELQMADVGGFTQAQAEARADAEGAGAQADRLWQRELAEARDRLPAVRLGDAELQALAGAAIAFGVPSLRATLHAARVARAHAAWCGREAVDAEDAGVALRLVLLPRATQLPTTPEETPADPLPASERTTEPAPADAPPPPPPPDAQRAEPPPAPAADDPPEAPVQAPAETLQEQLIAAALAALPPGVLARLAMQARATGGGGRGAGGAGQLRAGARRGRPAGVRRALPGRGVRLSLIDTLRAAAPWQGVRAAARPLDRAREAALPLPPAAAPLRRSPRVAPAGPDRATLPTRATRLQVRAEDFHVRRYQQRSETTTVFVVDASGSAALRRLAEAKGAVELLLADCYVRRDSVALVAFRGSGAELLLPPTRSLVRARRSLAALPGGGGTPLASGLDVAFGVADAVRRRGDLPLLVLLTDGRANVGRSGAPGREAAEADARQSARLWRAAGLTALVVDTSVRPHPLARQLAEDMGAAYLALPQADAQGLSAAVGGALNLSRR